MEIGTRIRLLRKEKGISQDALDQKGQSLGMALEMLLVIVRHLLSEQNLPAARQQLEMAKKVYQLLREDTVQFRSSLFDLEQLKREIDAVETAV